jgi:hypothetical protein
MHWFTLRPGYRLFIVDRAGKRCIARCIFHSGCNSVVLNEIKVYDNLELEAVEWTNVDGGKNDGVVSIENGFRTGSLEPALDVVIWTYTHNLGVLRISNLKYEYIDGYQRVRGCEIERFRGKLISEESKSMSR